MGDVVCVCYRRRDQEEVDKVFFRQWEEISCSQALVYTGDFNHSDIFWRDNTASYKQSRKF